MAEQIPLPCVTGGGLLMTVQQVANFLNLSADRVRQLADLWKRDPTKGLPHIRAMGYGFRVFPEADVEAYKLRKREIEEQRREHLQTWRLPVPAKRSLGTQG